MLSNNTAFELHLRHILNYLIYLFSFTLSALLSGSRDPVGDLVSCVKDKVKDKPVCLEYASTLSARLTPVKDEACANLQEGRL